MASFEVRICIYSAPLCLSTSDDVSTTLELLSISISQFQKSKRAYLQKPLNPKHLCGAALCLLVMDESIVNVACENKSILNYMLTWKSRVTLGRCVDEKHAPFPSLKNKDVRESWQLPINMHVRRLYARWLSHCRRLEKCIGFQSLDIV